MQFPVHNERVVEVPWLLDRVASAAPRRILDVGAADALYAPALIASGADVTLLDIRPFVGPPGARIAIGPAQAMPDSWASAFDLVICLSTLDHIGLDAYGQIAAPRALAEVARELWRVTAPGGRLLLSAPVGRDQLTTHPDGGQRVFGHAALWALFPAARWSVEHVRLWRWDGDAYAPARTWDSVADAAYLGWRAEAVAAVALIKYGQEG